MITLVDDRFRDEAERFGLRYTCETCAHFESSAGTCAMGYPPVEHRQRDLTKVETIVFCKAYELE